jgi:hypothetical protein
MTGDDWTTAATEVVEDWDATQQWSDARARQVQQANDGRRAVELLRKALAGDAALTGNAALTSAPALADVARHRTADAA